MLALPLLPLVGRRACECTADAAMSDGPDQRFDDHEQKGDRHDPISFIFIAKIFVEWIDFQWETIQASDGETAQTCES